ncbi:MAG TPA: TlpA disulfide reductase family protein [Pyrinomonadaceae bacterium]|jgi:thiol-disulfide isomerase/thioredoxin|nr:TlpA disulfide reductase family protein [Pyrinomonadaceae bacterium]
MKNRLTRALVLSLLTVLGCAYAPSQSSLLPGVAAQTRPQRPAVAVPNKKGSPQASTGKTSEADTLPVVREVDLADLRKLLPGANAKARPLLINFWATWCEPCRDEFPDLVKIDEQYGAGKLDFITVSLDDVADIKKGVPEYLQKMHARMPAYLLNVPDPEEVINLVDPQWSGAMPATFLFDPHGTLVFKHMGRIKPDELRAAIEKVTSDK